MLLLDRRRQHGKATTMPRLENHMSCLGRGRDFDAPCGNDPVILIQYTESKSTLLIAVVFKSLEKKIFMCIEGKDRSTVQ